MGKSDNLYDLMGRCFPKDHAQQIEAPSLLERFLTGTQNASVLDLGCGDGSARRLVRRFNPTAKYIGVDIASSPEVDSRKYQDDAFKTYDGINIPLPDASVDIVYSSQVFEHVRHPEPLLRDITRVLKPGGHFLGSVSYLEPYHSFSIWNFTPYGWKVVVEDAGMHLLELRPGIDSVALIRRSYLGRPAKAAKWFTKSPLNERIDLWGWLTRRRPQLINLRKVMYTGHLAFVARRP